MHEVLDRLAAEDAQKAELVKLRFFVGLSLVEAGAVLGLPERTAKRHWAYARAWLFDAIRLDENSLAGRGPFHRQTAHKQAG